MNVDLKSKGTINYIDEIGQIDKIYNVTNYVYSMNDFYEALKSRDRIEYNESTDFKDYAIFKLDFIAKLAKIGLDISFGSIYTNEFYNFEMLKISKDFPDRSERDTFNRYGYEQISAEFVNKLVLKPEDTSLIFENSKWYSPKTFTTHTSANVWEHMTKFGRGGKHAIFGKALRREREDKTHQMEFESVDLYIDNEMVSYKTLRWIIIKIFKQYNLEICINPTYYPYVAPAIEIILNGLIRDYELAGAGLYYNTLLNQIDDSCNLAIGAGIGISRLWMMLTGYSELSYINQLKQ